MEFIDIPEQGTIVGAESDPFLAEIITQTQGLYKDHGYQWPWIGYLVKVDDQWIGTCAFKTPPRDRRIEIAYYTFAGFEGRGFATLMAKRLITIAKINSPMTRITARTLPEVNASGSVLKKNGLTCLGRIHDPIDGDLWEWSLPEFEEGTYGLDGCGG